MSDLRMFPLVLRPRVLNPNISLSPGLRVSGAGSWFPSLSLSPSDHSSSMLICYAQRRSIGNTVQCSKEVANFSFYIRFLNCLVTGVIFLYLDPILLFPNSQFPVRGLALATYMAQKYSCSVPSSQACSYRKHSPAELLFSIAEKGSTFFPVQIPA
ncbi:hypothetical protein, unlikely [Trypanosoma brucei gambiense DAL972]|uniref:Uncharacterized protein n=2 Tax=Trypanosoma brucei TaxID=5691 RepID=C9ZIL0_TRYB9|nr:hypothetical protein, unlikely [Trypanosoma brucei gambiense DAL972]RHW74346.1 hypothetical protein DPX39_010030500 [Trypanosoma brucei equiperdum]CBH09002.1 hypothetical protein, unlikely [Trypanosoma brucei gambiense DAL972]|eukprot:XP_011771443.1 hypothetical protein, unlikely [Trypanosoma brucei gambiense DAL972]